MKCNDFVFCRLCAAFSGTRTRLLREACPKEPVGKTKKAALKKMLQGISQYEGRRGGEGESAGVPLQFCCWLDPVVGDNFLQEPGGGRSRRNAPGGGSQDDALGQQRRPLWTIEARERLAQEIEILAGRKAAARRARVQERVARLALEEFDSQRSDADES